MKKIYLAAFVVVSAFALSSCTKDEKKTGQDDQGDVYSSITVEEKNTALVTKHSGTACPPCGGWGWTAWEEIVATNTGKAHFVTAFDDNFVAKLFITDVAEDWANGLGVSSWPTFCANYKIQTERVGNGIDVAKTKTNVSDEVNTHVNAPVVANSAFVAKTSENIMTVNVKTKFFNAADGDYYLAVYLVEDDVMGVQSGNPNYPNPVAHEFVMRQIRDENGTNLPAFGKMLSSGSVDAGTEFKSEVKLKLDSDWKSDKLHTYAVIWKKVGAKYQFVNMAK